MSQGVYCSGGTAQIEHRQDAQAGIEKAADEKNYLEIGSIAHKMLSSFNQLKVVSVAPLLKELEDLLHKKSEVVESPDYINELVDEVEQNSQIVISSIADEMVV